MKATPMIQSKVPTPFEFGEYLGRMDKEPTAVFMAVCKLAGVDPIDVRYTKFRHKRLVLARTVAVWALRRYTLLSYPEITRIVRPGKIHSTTIDMFNRSERLEKAADRDFITLSRQVAEFVESHTDGGATE